MHTLEIPEKKITLTFPEKVEELNPEQAKFFMEQILQYQAGKFDLSELKIRIVYHLLDMKKSWNYHSMLPEQKEQVWANIYRLSEVIDSFFVPGKDSKGNDTKVIDWSTAKNLLPRINKYYGPQDALLDLTFFEYKEAYSRYVQLAETQDENLLNELIAILYRRKKLFYRIIKHFPKFDGQIRRKFSPKTNPNYLAKRAADIAKISQAEKQIVLLYFRNSIDFIVTGKINIDGKEIDLSVLYKKGSDDSSKSDIGMAGLLFSLAESKVFGNIDETADVNIYTVFARLYQLKMDSEAIKSKAND